MESLALGDGVESHFAGRLFDLAPRSHPERTPPGICRSHADELHIRYRSVGERFLDGVRGEFAVHVHDPHLRLDLGARSGLGDESLSYRTHEKGVSFGGDDAELLGASWAVADLDPLRWAEYFGYQEVSGPATFFSEVRNVLPGEMVLCRDGQLRHAWIDRVGLAGRIELASWEEYVEGFTALLVQAVDRSLGDEPRVAVWLSGGLDSSPIAALAARAGRRVDALVWKVSDSGGNEARFAAAVAGHSKLELSWIPCDDALPFSDLRNWPILRSIPAQGAYRWFHQRSYARAAELGNRVVLNGFGGDMLYGNSRRWFWDLFAAAGIGPAIDRLRDSATELGWWPVVRSQVLSPLLPRRRPAPALLPGYLTTTARCRLSGRTSWRQDFAEARRPRQAERLLALLDASGAHFEKQYAALYGLDVRFPLRDRDLVEYMLAVPDHLLQQGRETRPVLRSATVDLLPEVVRCRRGKAHFREVLDRGLRPENLPWASELLLEPAALWRGFVEEAAVRRWLAGHLVDDWDRLGFIQCLSSELWRFHRAGGELADLSG